MLEDRQKGEYSLSRGLVLSPISTGRLTLDEGGMKEESYGASITVVFFVIDGIVSFQINDAEFVVTSGCHCMVPRFNSYSLRNLGDCKAHLFFCSVKF